MSGPFRRLEPDLDERQDLAGIVSALASKRQLSALLADLRLVTGNKIRSQYRAHVAQMLELLGDTPAAAANSATVVAIETTLARSSLGTADKRDPHKTFHTFDARGLQTMAKSMPKQDGRAFEKRAACVAWGPTPSFGALRTTACGSSISRLLELRAQR